MKPKHLSKKLSLNKTTVSTLNDEKMDDVRGGTTMNTICYGGSCPVACELSVIRCSETCWVETGCVLSCMTC